LLVIALALAPAGCRHMNPDDGNGWHVQSIAECGFSVELPGHVRRSDTLLPDGSRSILYMTDGQADKYIIACTTLAPAMPTATPAEALRGQLANHESVTELGGIGTAIVDTGLEDAPDGGRYWLLFENGMRIEGRVRLTGRQIADLSGSVTAGSPKSRAALDRMLASDHQQ
jgi:hypothetical protein